MKLHFKKTRHGQWGVWRDRFSSTYALPVTVAPTISRAYEKYLDYTGEQQ